MWAHLDDRVSILEIRASHRIERPRRDRQRAID
jgi:hypothetical protein